MMVFPPESSPEPRVGANFRNSRLHAELAPLAIAVEIGAPQQPTIVLNASYLVASDSFERFDKTAEQLAKQRGELMEFKLIGPMPAHSFADRDLSTATAAKS